ncbi:Hypothetical predicted protein [Mytilus galloprovincialis]|uniref:Uncharacterized protein n=1 Tax=Mytilus galloprovincialis TaxID=29158 RepID=A0A8B6EMM9_MYTGA|nr:Hypothetical predicted protein [Mytilus galloprovincialis]
MMRAFTIVFMVQLSLISVSLGEHKKWSGSEADWKAYYAYRDYQDSAWRKAYLDYKYSEAANKYSKDKQDNGDTNEESDERKIKGDCWKGLACSACDKTVVGNINGVPVCCENCEKSGIRYGREGKYSTCDCLHNGKK